MADQADEAIRVPVTRTAEQVDLVRGLGVTLGVESHQDRVGLLSASDDLEAIAQLGRDEGSCVQVSSWPGWVTRARRRR